MPIISAECVKGCAHLKPKEGKMLTVGFFYNQQCFSYLFILCLGVLLVNMICGEVATELKMIRL